MDDTGPGVPLRPVSHSPRVASTRLARPHPTPAGLDLFQHVCPIPPRNIREWSGECLHFVMQVFTDRIAGWHDAAREAGMYGSLP